VFGCEGISTRQHDEPAGNQDIWLVHRHVFPRGTVDRPYERHAERAPAAREDIDERAGDASPITRQVMTGRVLAGGMHLTSRRTACSVGGHACVEEPASTANRSSPSMRAV
jgi:hypothetical protein